MESVQSKTKGLLSQTAIANLKKGLYIGETWSAASSQLIMVPILQLENSIFYLINCVWTCLLRLRLRSVDKRRPTEHMALRWLWISAQSRWLVKKRQHEMEDGIASTLRCLIDCQTVPGRLNKEKSFVAERSQSGKRLICVKRIGSLKWRRSYLQSESRPDAGEFPVWSKPDGWMYKHFNQVICGHWIV